MFTIQPISSKPLIFCESVTRILRVLNCLLVYLKLLQVFGEKSYDALDLDEKEFIEDYEQFTDHIHDLDKRLASIICQGYDDCSGLESAFRVSVYLHIKDIF